MIKIISDSTCDLSKELVERYNIAIIPLHILLGEEEYEDGNNISREEIFAWSDEHKTTPKTSAPSIEKAMEVIKEYTDQDYDVICFGISTLMSASCKVMELAAQSLGVSDRVKVVDSANLSTGVGLLVIEAAIMASKGSSVQEIIDQMEKLKPYVRSSFVVDTLTYLHRGGRCSGLAAFAGSALKLHPRINVIDGAMEPGKKYRGTLNKVILSYASDLEPELLKAKKDRVFITHSGCSSDIVESVREYLSSLGVFVEVHETLTAGVVSSHCGPGTLGILFIENPV